MAYIPEDLSEKFQNTEEELTKRFLNANMLSMVGKQTDYNANLINLINILTVQNEKLFALLIELIKVKS